MNKFARIQRQRCAQDQAQCFFKATDGLIALSCGTDAISRQASKSFTEAVYLMFLHDQNINLKEQAIDDGTFLLFNYLQSQTLNGYIDAVTGTAYGRALAQALIDLHYCKEQEKLNRQICIGIVEPVLN